MCKLCAVLKGVKMTLKSTQDVFREWAMKSADLAAKLYDTEPEDRLMLIPILTSTQLEQLEHFGKGPVWDGYLISKAARQDLCQKGLATSWNGMNFITQAGMAVLDTLKSRVLQEKTK
jgi:hypothetical protein